MKYNTIKKQRRANLVKHLNKSQKKAWTPLVRIELSKENFPEVNVDDLEYDEYWMNNEYIVKVYYPDNPVHQFPNNKFTWLCFRNLRNSHHAHDWRDMQMMKNEICGHERTAVEVFPPMSKLVDTCNQFHMWVYPEDYKLDFGYNEQSIMPNTTIAKEIFNVSMNKAIKEASTEEEKRYLLSTKHRVEIDPTHGKQRAMGKYFLSPELMDKFGYTWSDN